MISVVVPSFNRCDCILRLLGDLRLQQGADFEVVVVDDGSTDNTPERVRTEFPEVRLFVNERNSGPCVTRNRGILEAGGDLIVGLDSDVSLRDPGLLRGIRQEFELDPLPIGIAMRILTPDGGDDGPRWWHPVPLASGGNREFETGYFSGTAYAFRRLDLIEAGLFPEIYYMHYEEVELAWRLLDRGVRILHMPRFEVVHHAGPSIHRNRIQVFLKPRNQILLTLRCHPFLLGLKFLVPRLAYNAGRAVLDGHSMDFFAMLKSAASLSRRCLRERRPISSATWSRLRSMRRQAGAGRHLPVRGRFHWVGGPT
jgi:GT2 family glycosyltransferase